MFNSCFIDKKVTEYTGQKATLVEVHVSSIQRSSSINCLGRSPFEPLGDGVIRVGDVRLRVGLRDIRLTTVERR
jgi:hypothetical protein